jgi:hypothetical protein
MFTVLAQIQTEILAALRSVPVPAFAIRPPGTDDGYRGVGGWIWHSEINDTPALAVFVGTIRLALSPAGEVVLSPSWGALLAFEEVLELAAYMRELENAVQGLTGYCLVRKTDVDHALQAANPAFRQHPAFKALDKAAS